MQDNNLDDLIIDNISPKNSNTKSFLTIIGMAIVVLIIAIILTKIILKDPNSDFKVEDNNSELISPELTLQNTTQEKDIITKPLIPTIEKIKPEVNIPTANKEITAAPVITKPVAPKVETVKINNEFAIDEEIKRKDKAEAEATRIAKEKEISRKNEAQKREKLQQEQARIAEEKAKQTSNNNKITNPYFIQVGSFSKTPSSRFLSVIKNSGFNYQITVPSSSGTKKLLVGPYKTKSEATNALVKVKDRINKSAYIIRK